MKIKAISRFKNEMRDREYFEHWVKQLEKANQRKYERIEVKTSLGITQVWGLNSADPKLETLVIFPGARTTALIWDFDRGLDNLNQKSLENAKKLIKPLKDIKVFQNVGHGVETYPMAMKYIWERIKEVS